MRLEVQWISSWLFSVPRGTCLGTADGREGDCIWLAMNHDLLLCYEFEKNHSLLCILP